MTHLVDVEAREVFEDPRVVALIETAHRGDVAEVRALSAAGVDRDVQGKLGITPNAPARDRLRAMLEARGVRFPVPRPWERRR